jgi:hypothetical protein
MPRRPSTLRARSAPVFVCLLCPATVDAALVRPGTGHGWTFKPIRGAGLAVPICPRCTAELAAERGEEPKDPPVDGAASSASPSSSPT